MIGKAPAAARPTGVAGASSSASSAMYLDRISSATPFTGMRMVRRHKMFELSWRSPFPVVNGVFESCS